VNNVLSHSSPVQEITSGTDWCYISSGRCQSTAIKTNNTLWMWGLNGYCLLGNFTGDRSSPIQEITSNTCWSKVSVGYSTALGIKTT
jgi:hypothetical protein